MKIFERINIMVDSHPECQALSDGQRTAVKLMVYAQAKDQGHDLGVEEPRDGLGLNDFVGMNAMYVSDQDALKDLLDPKEIFDTIAADASQPLTHHLYETFASFQQKTDAGRANVDERDPIHQRSAEILRNAHADVSKGAHREGDDAFEVK